MHECFRAGGCEKGRVAYLANSTSIKPVPPCIATSDFTQATCSVMFSISKVNGGRHYARDRALLRVNASQRWQKSKPRETKNERRQLTGGPHPQTIASHARTHLADGRRPNGMREVEAAEQLIRGNIELPRQHFRYTARGHGRNVVVEFAADGRHGKIQSKQNVHTAVRQIRAGGRTRAMNRKNARKEFKISRKRLLLRSQTTAKLPARNLTLACEGKSWA